MEKYIELISVPTIAMIIYVINNALKKATNNNEKFLRFIPLLSLVMGAIMGVICFYCVPGYVDTSNVFSALIVGGSSGISATGANQLFKQFAKHK